MCIYIYIYRVCVRLGCLGDTISFHRAEKKVVWPFGEKDPGVGMQQCLGGKLNGDESKTLPYFGR